MTKIPITSLKSHNLRQKTTNTRQEETHATEGAWPVVGQDQFGPHVSAIRTQMNFRWSPVCLLFIQNYIDYIF